MLKENVGGGSEVKMTHYAYTKNTRGTKLKVKADKQAKMQQTDELVQCLRYYCKTRLLPESDFCSVLLLYTVTVYPASLVFYF